MKDIQKIDWAMLAEPGFDLRAFYAPANGAEPAMSRVVGTCFAFPGDRLEDDAAETGVSWHVRLLQKAIAGLLDEASKKPALVCYALQSGMVRLFFCCLQKRYPGKFHDAMKGAPGFLESGQDGFPVAQARPLAYWEPPGTAIALWPTGLEGETDEPRVVDTGNAAAYFSYPESDHDSGVPVDEAGPEYVRVPQAEQDEFIRNGRNYRYLNRWVDLRGSPKRKHSKGPARKSGMVDGDDISAEEADMVLSAWLHGMGNS